MRPAQLPTCKRCPVLKNKTLSSGSNFPQRDFGPELATVGRFAIKFEWTGRTSTIAAADEAVCQKHYDGISPQPSGEEGAHFQRNRGALVMPCPATAEFLVNCH